jgi:septal ring factor EnvC (AmiA/AmiB activator)
VAEHRRTLDALSGARTSLRQRQSENDALKRQAQAARAALDQLLAARNALVKSIDERRDLNAQLTGDLQGAQQKLQAALNGLSTGSPVTELTLPLRPFQGALPWPADGPVTARFGRLANGQPVGSGRNGVEIAAPEGAAVTAVHDGIVQFADPFTGFGRLVIIDHGAQSFSLYGYLSTTSVKKGDHVDRGTPVGAVGVSPIGLPGLYFELRVDGKPVDPLQWLKRNRM